MMVYKIEEVCAFSTAKGKWGEFGNMTGGFPIRISRDLLVPSTENLYQAMRFTHRPDIQEEIIAQKSGMGAKMVAKKYRRAHTRPDFEDFKVDIMEWCLELKLAQHKKYRDVLLDTDDRDIVEISKKDDFWGAKFNEDCTVLTGTNQLGILHMRIREKFKKSIGDEYKLVNPVEMDSFNLLGQIVPILDFRKKNEVVL